MAQKGEGFFSAKTISQIEQVVAASLRPLPTETGDGTYIPEEPSDTGIAKDLLYVDLNDVKTMVEVSEIEAMGEHVDDRHYIMERIIQLASGLPATSKNGKDLTNKFLLQLWSDLKHPPTSLLGRENQYRHADGSNNNPMWPKLGAARTPYARSVQPKSMQLPDLPDPGVIFDSILARKDFKEHPNKISSLLFYLATLITHDIFETDHEDSSVNLTSSYLDLSPLYGNNQEEQNTVRTFINGKLKPDCFATRRLLGFPPGVGVLVMMFNRFHNYVAEQLAQINEGERFTKPSGKDPKAYAKYDDDLFQTARLVTCGLYVNVILKDYVRTILNVNRTNSTWSLDPRSDMGDMADFGTGNQVSAEFNAVYRWHSCLSQRDEEWLKGMYKELFPGQDSSNIPMPDFLRGLAQWQAKLSADPQKRAFAGLKRKADGAFDDNELVEILKTNIEDCAGAFGALQVPECLKNAEILGIIQARSWNLATLNEFRQFFNLAPYKSFEEINPDPYVADQLRRLYDHPDSVELYPGVNIESAKDLMAPGSGLCTNFTISRAILSDAVGLVRSDRFYTTDFTPRNLTNWAFNEISTDTSVDGGQVLYKLILRSFPRHFKDNSVYAHFPFIIPSENQKILSRLGLAEQYDFEPPAFAPFPRFINSHAACMTILSDKETFNVIWGRSIEFLMKHPGKTYGRDFMLSGDKQPNCSSRKMMGAALYRQKWEAEVRKFYEDITLQLLRQHSYKIAGVNQVDIVRDVANMAQTHFCANVFSLPLKTEDHPRGIFTESELYTIMAVVFACIFYNVDVAKSFQLRHIARSVTQQLGQLVMANVELVKKSGFISSIMNMFHKREPKQDILSEYGVHMIQRLLDTGVPADEIVWTHVLPTAGGMVANQAQLFSQCLDYYLSEEGSVHLSEINRLAKEDTAEADELLLRYFMEGARLRSSVALPREVTKETVINEHGQKVKLQPGDEVLCNLVAACMDPVAFPEPHKVKLDRDMGMYAHFGFGPHQCIGMAICKLALTTMLKVVGRLDNLRRAPGPQGHLKRLAGLGGISKYMTADQKSFFPFPTTMKVQWDGELPGAK